MPTVRFSIFVLSVCELKILNKAGPEIFGHLKDMIEPSGSDEAFPSSKTLVTGKTREKLGPAFAIGGLLVCKQSSHEYSFLQEYRMKQSYND
jgi:hypothetical protein